MLKLTVLALTVIGGVLPPAQYDHPFDGKVVIHRTQMPPNRLAYVWGGVAGDSGICTIYISPYLTGRDYELIVRHEVGHCNGWPGHHPRR